MSTTRENDVRKNEEEMTSLIPTYRPSIDKEKGKEKVRTDSAKISKMIPVEAEDVVIVSKLVDSDSDKQTEKIRKEFNKEAIATGKSCFSTASVFRGDYLNKDEFLLGHRNKIPELATFNRDSNTTMSVKVDGTQIEKIGVFKSYELFFGAHGNYVLNVPQDKYAKAMSGNAPVIFGPGPHVIKDPTFKFNPATGLVNQNETVIKHGNLHIIRVPKGSYAKIWIGSEPYVLEYRPEQYTFNSPLFRMDSNGKNNFFAASDMVIKHGPLNNIRVPAGYIAKAWDGSVPKLLESREEPYYYDSPTFYIESNGDKHFFPATDQLIEHGSIKRILPPINHVAVVSNGGNLLIVGPAKDGSPTVIDSPSQRVEGFISTSVQTLIFPSEETKAQRIKDDKDATKESVHYEVFTTKDSLKVGVKLLVAYQITNADLVIKTLGMDGIISHIENLANVDMGMAIQQSSSQEFLTFYQTKPHREEGSPGGYGATSSTPPQHYQDIVKTKLARDLEEVGIKLVRLNIENPIILNKKIADQMEQQSMLAAEANAKEAVIRQNYNIEIAKADREAAIKEVAQKQTNLALLSTAQAKLETTKLEAESQRVAAQARADALLIEAKAKQEAAALEGKMLSDNPALLQMRMLEIKMAALQNIKFYPPQAGTMPPGSAANPFMLFNQFADESVPAKAPIVEQKPKL